jgi:alkanesulfonate monooxygenase SsuD/methylene tetrahydromethanopterin reductase-like flavin-dependent oxidoreductase (luciferase family)
VETIALGYVLETVEDPVLGYAPRWSGIRRQAQLAQDAGFDTVWVADELQWESEEWERPIGFWECVAIAGAVAASTDRVKVGTWVLSALHRNPGLTARVAETLAEISGGRFILGLGSGHAGRQGEAFGFAPNYTVSRYEESLAIIAALRSDGEATYDGSFHSAKGLVMTPRPDGPPAIPLLLGGHKPRTMRLAVEHADIWSAFATTSSQPEAFVELLAQLDEICEEVGRDPATLGRSIGVAVAPPNAEPEGLLAQDDPIRGSVDQIVDTFSRFAEMGCTRIEVLAAGSQEATIEGLAPVVDALGAGGASSG